MKEIEFDTKILCLRDTMYRLARSLLGEESEAQDAVQDILEKMWRDRDKVRGYTNIKGFILVSVRNNCLDRIRKRKTRYSVDLDHSRQLSEKNPGNYDNEDLVRIAKRAMSELPEKQRSVMHLRDIEGMELEEIAEVMDIDPGAVRSNLSRARKKVRDEINKALNHGIRKNI